MSSANHAFVLLLLVTGTTKRNGRGTSTETVQINLERNILKVFKLWASQFFEEFYPIIHYQLEQVSRGSCIPPTSVIAYWKHGD